LTYQLKEECSKYAQDLAFEWDELENAEVSGKKLTLKNKNLKEGKLSIGILLTYNSVEINKVKLESTLVKYKLIPTITNSDNLKSLYGLDIKISAKLSKDEGFKRKAEDEDLKFKWICSDGLASLCEKIDKSELIIPFKDYELLIKKPTKTEEFKIELELSKDSRTAKKEVKLQLKKPIELKSSNGGALDLTDLIIITPTYSGAKDLIFKISFALPTLKFSDYKYYWTIKSFKNENQYLNSRQENCLKIIIDDLLSGVNEIILEVKDPKTEKVYTKIYTYLKPEPPYGGRCSLQKPNGISFQDDFKFSISGWISKKEPLLYKIKFLNEEENFIDISMGGFLGNNFSTKVLPVGDTFFLEAIDSSGFSNTIPCPLKVSPNKALLQMEEYLEKIFNPVEKMIIMDVYKSNLANGGSVLPTGESEEEYVDPRIAINDEAINMTFNLLNSGQLNSDNLETVVTSLVSVSPEPYSDKTIIIAINCLEIIANNIELIIDKLENVKLVYKIGDNLMKKIELLKENVDVAIKEQLGKKTVEKIQSFKTSINDKLFNNVISGQSLVISTPAVDTKLTKASSLNVPTVAMEYEDEEKLLRKNKRNKRLLINIYNYNIRFTKKNIRNIKIRYLQNKAEDCDPDLSAFCLDKDKMGALMNSTATDSVGFKGELNKDVQLPIKQEQFSNSMNFHFSDEDNKGRRLQPAEGGLSFDFEVRLKLPKNKKISEMGPATCIQYEEDGSVADVSCMSYYDTETRESVCACVRQGLTVNVKDPVLAELSKKRQFPPLMDSFCKFFKKYF